MRHLSRGRPHREPLILNVGGVATLLFCVALAVSPSASEAGVTRASAPSLAQGASSGQAKALNRASAPGRARVTVVEGVGAEAVEALPPEVGDVLGEIEPILGPEELVRSEMKELARGLEARP